MQENEKRINLIDVFLNVLEGWRILFVVLIIALIAGFLAGKYIQHHESANLYEEALNKYEKALSSNYIDAEANNAKLERLYEKLGVEDMQMVDMYISYKELYNELLEVNKQDALMQFDPYNVSHVKMMYTISANNAENVQIICKYYVYLLANEGELMPFLQIYEDYPGATVISDDDGNTLSLEKGNNALIYVTVRGTDEEHVKETIREINSIIGGAYTEISELYGIHGVSCLEGDCYVTSDNDIVEYQKLYMDSLYTYRNRLINIKSNLTDQAKKYINEYEKQELQQIRSEMDEAEDVEEPNKSSYYAEFSIKIVLIVVVGVMFLAIIIMMMGYICNPCIRLNEDMDFITSLPVIARIVCGGKVKGIKKLRYGSIARLSKDEAVNIAAANIRVFAKNHGINKFYITGTVMGEAERDISDEIIKSVNNKDIKIVVGGSSLYNAEAKEQAATEGNVLLVEKAGTTRRSELIRELHDLELNVLGIVLFE